jgi:predicted nucleotidyltransferase
MVKKVKKFGKKPVYIKADGNAQAHPTVNAPQEAAQAVGPAPQEGMEEFSLAKMLEQFFEKKDAKAVETYAGAVLQKFQKYIKSIAIFGSKKTKVKTRKTSDIDIAIIVDDTDVRRMTRAELKDKLFQRLCEMGFPISKKIHPQPYLLTEFWQYVMEGNPVIYNVLRDGIIIFDSGFFMPLQMLMKMGNIKPSKEAIDKHMYIAEELIGLSENTMLTKLTYDLEQAVVSSAQAVLMELGYRPPAPNETGKFVREHLVEEKKLCHEKYARIAEDTVRLYKDVEHKERKTFTGAEWDKFYEEVKDFVKTMKEILTKIRKEKGESFLYEAVEKKNKVEVRREGEVKSDKEKPEEKADTIIREQLGQR